jgi:trehalose 6-phosphate phosphatase
MTSSPSPPALERRHALFLDFDGTLAEIQDDPDTVALPEGGARLLARLADHLGGALAILSGRDVRDLSARVPDALWRAGGHGLEVCAPMQSPAPQSAQAPEALRRAIIACVEDLAGVRVEMKGEVIAVHYRGAPDAAGLLAERLGAALEDRPDYSLQHGKMVFETKPARAHKGAALSQLMACAPFSGRIPVMVGDDTTDEDAMKAALAADGLAVKVGDGPTVADIRLATPQGVWAWLQEAL